MNDESVVLSGKLPIEIEAIFVTVQSSDAVFAALMPALCDAMKCDRYFLYVRNPQTAQGPGRTHLNFILSTRGNASKLVLTKTLVNVLPQE